MQEDRRDAAEADEDGGEGDEEYEINSMAGTSGHREKENAPWHLNMSRSNLKAQNEQAQVKPYSANAEDQFGSTLNEPTY